MMGRTISCHQLNPPRIVHQRKWNWVKQMWPSSTLKWAHLMAIRRNYALSFSSWWDFEKKKYTKKDDKYEITSQQQKLSANIKCLWNVAQIYFMILRYRMLYIYCQEQPKINILHIQGWSQIHTISTLCSMRQKVPLWGKMSEH